MLTGTTKFIIHVDDKGEIEVHDGSDKEISEANRGNLADTAVDLSAANKLIRYDSLAILGFGSDRIVTRICVKRANCSWYCS